MGVSKVTLNGETLMDITSDTVNQNNLLSGQYAHGADGESVVGNYQPTAQNIATETQNGLMSSEDKRKLNGIASSAQVNQNAFSNVRVGSTTIAADAKEDTLTLVAGPNITLAPNKTNDSVTISVNGLGSAASAAISSRVQDNATLPTGAAVQRYISEAGYTSNTGTVTKISMGDGLRQGDITDTGTIQLDLVNRSRLNSAAIPAPIQRASNVYPVALDRYGKLAVNVNIDKNSLELDKVENKSSETIRQELTQENVTAALGFTPYTPEEINDLIASADITGGLQSVTIAGKELNPTNSSINALQLSDALRLGSAAYKQTTNTIDNDDNIPTGAAIQNYIAGLGYTRNTGTVTKVTAGDGLTGGDITTSGTISLTEVNVSGGSAGPTAATEGNEGVKVSIPRLTVDKYGRVTALSSYDLTNKDTTYISRDAVLGGSSVSLVTTGEKYIWNDKISEKILAKTSDIEIESDGTSDDEIVLSTDVTLSLPNVPADAKAVGDALANVIADGSIRTVENMEQLLETTEDTVLVLHNDSTYGDGGACLFEATDGVRYYGYQRTSDGKYMIPSTDQSEVVTNDPPIDALMSVMKTWVGNENVKHLTVGSTDNGSLFGETIRQVDGKWTMDCSAFTSAVLMGITYNNSRYVLGNNANNIELEYFPGAQFPPSRWVGKGRTKGGLGATETAMWLAEHKRLYSFDEDPDKALAQLQFGDIVFGSNSIYPTYYKNVEHIMIVLGTIPSQGLLIASESIDLSYDETHYEQSGAHITVLSLKDSTTGKTNDYYRIWGRPDYSHIGKKKDVIVPKSANSYTYNCFFLEASLVCRGTSDSSSIPAGKLMSDRYSAATPDFYPAIPGSVVSYTGASRCDRGVYLCRVHEFDDTKKLIKSTTIAYASNGNPMTNPVTIGSTTKYLRFTFGLQSNTMSDTSIGIWMSNLDDCEITVSLPS